MKNIITVPITITIITMNTLNIEQIESIRNYWERRNEFTSQINEILAQIEYTLVSKNLDCDEDEEEESTNEISVMEQNMEEINKTIETIDAEYEEMLLGFGLRLYDRDMEEDLFSFINNGEEE